MIIVNTTNGAIFINEKQADLIRHYKKEKQVEVVIKGGDEMISDVEAVTYITDSQPTTWQEEGSEVGQLKGMYEELKADFDAYFDFCNKRGNIIDEYALTVRRLLPHAQREKFLKDELERLDHVVRGRYPEFNVTFGHDDAKSE